jgi:rRNA maturation endonuclease Nob1
MSEEKNKEIQDYYECPRCNKLLTKEEHFCSICGCCLGCEVEYDRRFVAKISNDNK